MHDQGRMRELLKKVKGMDLDLAPCQCDLEKAPAPPSGIHSNIMHANGATHSPPLKSNSDTIESVVVGVMSVRAWSLRACNPTTSARFLNGDLDLRRTQKAKFSFYFPAKQI
jgi:hypothetical protein